MVLLGLTDNMFGGTGAQTKDSELDLAGLVCNNLGNHQCINPKKGDTGGGPGSIVLGLLTV